LPAGDLKRQPAERLKDFALRLRQVEPDLGLCVDRVTQLGDLAADGSGVVQDSSGHAASSSKRS